LVQTFFSQHGDFNGNILHKDSLFDEGVAMKNLRLFLVPFFASAMFSQTASAPAPTFEAATIKPTAVDWLCNALTRPGGRLDFTGCTIEYLIHVAYGLDLSQILEGPNWIRTERFDLEAVPPPGSKSTSFIPKDAKLPPPAEELEMLKTLLAERFQLQVHEEIKEGPTYELMLKNRNSKLAEPKDKETRPIILNGFDDNVKGSYYLDGRNASMAVLAARLTGFLKRPVIDRTGLSDSYDFKVYYEETPGLGAAYSTYSSAVQQLGLALMSAKGPIRYLIIDHVERLPQH
jgi:uncharacterized protein (TIGR03435 family)